MKHNRRLITVEKPDYIVSVDGRIAVVGCVEFIPKRIRQTVEILGKVAPKLPSRWD